MDSGAEDGVHKPVPITTGSIEATLKEMFGEVECFWGRSQYRKRKSLRVVFMVLGKAASFEIRDAVDLVEIARTLVAIYGRCRASIVNEMARGVAMLDKKEEAPKEDEMRARIQKEKDRMAGKDS